jgi:hypothetical protein
MFSDRKVRTGALILLALFSVLALAAVGIGPASADPQREVIWTDPGGGGVGDPNGIGDPDVPTGTRSFKQWSKNGGRGAGSMQAAGDGGRGNMRVVELWITWLRTIRGVYFSF